MTTQEEQELIELIVDQARDLIGTLRASGFSHPRIINAISERKGLEEYTKHPKNSLVWRIGEVVHAIIDYDGETDDGNQTHSSVINRSEIVEKVRFKLLELYS